MRLTALTNFPKRLPRRKSRHRLRILPHRLLRILRHRPRLRKSSFDHGLATWDLIFRYDRRLHP